MRWRSLRFRGCGTDALTASNQKPVLLLFAGASYHQPVPGHLYTALVTAVQELLIIIKIAFEWLYLTIMDEI